MRLHAPFLFVGPVLAGLVALSACETPVPTGMAPGCELEINTRGGRDGDVMYAEVWVTAFDENRVVEVPSCVSVSMNGTPWVYCDENGDPDPTQCTTGVVEVRADTSLQMAYVEMPIAGDACNEPLDPGSYEVSALGLETGDLDLCYRQVLLPVVEGE
jgi:hypothetical protein